MFAGPSTILALTLSTNSTLLYFLAPALPPNVTPASVSTSVLADKNEQSTSTHKADANLLMPGESKDVEATFRRCKLRMEACTTVSELQTVGACIKVRTDQYHSTSVPQDIYCQLDDLQTLYSHCH